MIFYRYRFIVNKDEIEESCMTKRIQIQSTKRSYDVLRISNRQTDNIKRVRRNRNMSFIINTLTRRVKQEGEK